MAVISGARRGAPRSGRYAKRSAPTATRVETRMPAISMSGRASQRVVPPGSTR